MASESDFTLTDSGSTELLVPLLASLFFIEMDL